LSHPPQASLGSFPCQGEGFGPRRRRGELSCSICHVTTSNWGVQVHFTHIHTPPTISQPSSPPPAVHTHNVLPWRGSLSLFEKQPFCGGKEANSCTNLRYCGKRADSCSALASSLPLSHSYRTTSRWRTWTLGWAWQKILFAPRQFSKGGKLQIQIITHPERPLWGSIDSDFLETRQ